MLSQNWDQIPVIPINVNGLNSPIGKKNTFYLAYKQYPVICCIQKTHLRKNDSEWLKLKGWMKVPGKWKQ